ncbi:hypothetical protein HPB51_024368 [Rhipicephalus microplus]|uniref:CCHC-type domain-containing protein n=1 Tax=Rhipicephalus microplus TaxID=6941 RepID=A0A9J6D7J0_RHIMP|nr:hypothetical protein HPB51_024368 [Rhipicephalus microplus]
MSALMLADMVPSFTGGDTGPDVGVFFKILEQVGRLGGWRDNELVCIARCKMICVLSGSKIFDEAIAIALKEEQNEKVSRSHSLPVEYVEENTDVHEMHSRLDRLEKLVESLAVRKKLTQNWQAFPKQLPYPGGCSNCGRFGHFWRECHRYRRGKWNSMGGSRTHKGKERAGKFESGNLDATPPHDVDAQRSIAVVNIREETNSVNMSRGSPCAEVVIVISVIEEDVPPLSEFVFERNAGTLVPLGETNAVDVEVAGADTDGSAAASTTKVPRDDETLPVGVADMELDENGFSEDAAVGVSEDTVVDRTLEGEGEIEECLDRNGVVFVGPKWNCSTLDVHRTKPGHAQWWSCHIASHMPHSTTESSRWKFGPSNEGPELRVREAVCIQVDAERSGIG